MPTTIVINEAPATTTQWFVVYRLYETLLLAGWTVAYSSNGTTHDTSDNWAASFGGLGSGSYIILTGPGGRQVLFQRSTTSTILGTIRYSKGGGWGTAGAGATTPPTAPADAQTIRNGSNWFGSGANPVRLNIRCEDVATDGDWWVVFSTSTAWTSGGGGFLGFLALEETEVGDPEPYAWWCPDAVGSNWSYFLNDLRMLLGGQLDSATVGRFKKWWRAGEGDESFRTYGSGNIFPAHDAYGSGTWGENPTFGFVAPTARGGLPVIYRIWLQKRETSFRDPIGGMVKRLWFANPTEVPNLRTLQSGAFAKLGSWLVVQWNGDDLTPPQES
jgi:hypothetical protein